MATSALRIGLLSGSVTVPSMAATPEPDCAAAGEPMATNSSSSIDVVAREITCEPQCVITRPFLMSQSEADVSIERIENVGTAVLHRGNGHARC